MSELHNWNTYRLLGNVLRVPPMYHVSWTPFMSTDVLIILANRSGARSKSYIVTGGRHAADGEFGSLESEAVDYQPRERQEGRRLLHCSCRIR
jgi:hypothetical protein